MSAYENFTSDFPNRCIELLEISYRSASNSGREVTLLLMTASASLLVPFERLKPDTQYSSHPFRDNERFVDASEKLQNLMAENFFGSKLCPSTASSWRLARNVQSVDGDLDGWLPKVHFKPLSKERGVSATLTMIRNALAHGNIYTSGDPIADLIFVKEVTAEQADKSRKRVGFEVLSVNHADFLKFVRAWATFLNDSEVWGLRLVA